MKDQSWDEFQTLKQRHASLERELSSLAIRLAALEKRLDTQPTDLSPGLSRTAPLRGEPPSTPAKLDAPELGSELPPVISETSVATSNPPLAEPALPPTRAVGHFLLEPIAPAEPSKPTTPVNPAPSQPKSGNGDGAASFEMRLGTYWLVRIGVVMVLTALVFFGNLAYQNFISQMGPGGKVTLLYIASFALMGAGLWFQRWKDREAVKNYGQVLTAGGLAAVYFTTYAAHHFTNLRVITSPLLDGLLLLAWAGVIFWLADRHRSEVLALFAIGLAYYTSIITRVGHFTLYSNLILAATAGFFLLRHRWVRLTIVSLPATYGAYGYWRFFDGRGWSWPSPEQGLWTGAGFLFCYWALFTIAGFRSRQDDLKNQNRAFFLTANNLALFCMFILTMLQVREGGLWRFLAVYGIVLLALSVVARRWLEEEPIVRDAYLSQGLLLVTAALIAKFSGMRLALMLGLESTILLMLGRLRPNLILRVGSWLTAVFAIGWGLEDLRPFDSAGLWLGVGLGAIMVFNALTARRQSSPKLGLWFESEPGGFSILALAIWFGAVWQNTSPPYLSLVLVGTSMVLTFSVYRLRLPELSLLGQTYAFFGLVIWLGRLSTVPQSPPHWHHLVLVAAAVVLLHWWPRQDRIPHPRGVVAFEGFYSFAAVALLLGWFSPRLATGGWVWAGALLAVGCTLYAAFTRAWILALASQIFFVAAGVSFLNALQQGKPEWYVALLLVSALAGLATAADWWLSQHPETRSDLRDPISIAARVYRCAAVVLAIAWVCCCLGPNLRVAVLAICGSALFAISGLRRDRELLYLSGLWWAPVLAYFFVPEFGTPRLSWAHPLAILLLLALQRLSRAWHEAYNLDCRVHHTIIVVGGLCFWTLVSRYVLSHAAGFYLTASWSGVAVVLFTLGMVFRERGYRYLGLAVLGCALARVVIFDVWRLETLFRMLSFLALGIALLVLGFVYNRFQDKIKQWL